MPASEIYIEATGTDPSVQAKEVINAVQQDLLRSVRAQVGLLAELELGHDARESAREKLTAFCAGGLRGYLDACDQALYAPAAGAAETRLLVRALCVTAQVIDGHIRELTETEESSVVTSAARAIESVLAAHLAVEHDVLLPALAALPGADLSALAKDFETLRTGGQLETPDEVDVREIPHGQRHPTIFARFSRLAPGEGFTLVNNHDPKPLRREFQTAYADAFTWDYLEAGPQIWRVRIGRTGATGE